MHKSGFVSIVGRPNVGKSTLINAIIDQKLSIVSSKPQTTRSNVIGILDDEKYQIIFTDTPGYHRPRHKLGEYMIKSITDNLNEVDVILFMASPQKRISEVEVEMIEKLKNKKAPKILVLNKVDENQREHVMSSLKAYSEILDFDEYIPISALKRKNLDKLKEIIVSYIPEGPKYYGEDEISTKEERFFVSEIVREKILKLVQDEIPHGVGIEILTMKYDDAKRKYNIEGDIFCEKDSHKGILIGKDGEMLKKIATYARQDIEKFLGKRVYIKLWVKVRKDWRDNKNYLKDLGYN